MTVRTRELSRDPIQKKVVLHHYDSVERRTTIEVIQDVGDIVAVAEAERNLHSDYQRWKGDWHHVASIPLTIWMDLKKKGIIDDPAAFKRWLNDSDNRAFRSMPGRV